MTSRGEQGKVIHVQFPRQKPGDSDATAEQIPVGSNQEVLEEVEKYNFYREKLQAEALLRAEQDGDAIDVDPLDLTIEFHKLSKMKPGIERHVGLDEYLNRVKTIFDSLILTTPMVVYAMTYSEHSGPDVYQLVRYEGLLRDIIIDTSYKNWDEVMNSDVDVVEERTNLPSDLYFSLVPGFQAKAGTWRARQGAIANDIPFSQVLAIRHTKSYIPRQRTV